MLPFLRCLTSSSSFCVSASILRMSSMVSSTHLSIQQKSCRWKLVKIRFSCCTQRRKTRLLTLGEKLHSARRKVSENCSGAGWGGERVDIYFVDELLYFALKAPPLKLHSDEFVRTHSGCVTFCSEFCLLRKQIQLNKAYPFFLFTAFSCEFGAIADTNRSMFPGFSRLMPTIRQFSVSYSY